MDWWIGLTRLLLLEARLSSAPESLLCNQTETGNPKSKELIQRENISEHHDEDHHHLHRLSLSLLSKLYYYKKIYIIEDMLRGVKHNKLKWDWTEQSKKETKKKTSTRVFPPSSIPSQRSLASLSLQHNN